MLVIIIWAVGEIHFFPLGSHRAVTFVRSILILNAKMSSLRPSEQNNRAIRLLFDGKVSEAKALFREAIANTKDFLNSTECNFSSDKPRTDPATKLQGLLVPEYLTEDQSRQDCYAIPMFSKVFVTPEESGPEHLELVAASIFYNLAVTCSIGKNEYATYGIEHRLYSLSIEMINASGYLQDPSCSLLLMALCNNTAQSAFCDGRVDEARVALGELRQLLESRSLTCIDEGDIEFFYLNTLLMEENDRMEAMCSPAA